MLILPFSLTPRTELFRVYLYMGNLHAAPRKPAVRSDGLQRSLQKVMLQVCAASEAVRNYALCLVCVCDADVQGAGGESSHVLIVL